MVKPRIAYVLDPRFPGGTSSAVAAELAVVSQLGVVTVHAQSSAMFKGRDVAPQLQDLLLRLDITMIWDSPEIAADIVIFHNPSCLRFQDRFDAKIIARHFIVVAHENFLRPVGAEAFDVARCMGLLESSSFAVKRTLAPISAWNRTTITDWIAARRSLDAWSVLDVDWFNICAFPNVEPVANPTDRRGRLSRPGLEKFPQRDVMDLCFPPHADANVILGADAFIADDSSPAHWTLIPFRGLQVSRFFDMIDFMVYFTAPTFRESFGRVMAEAVAAGKIVISDPETSRIFGGAVRGAAPEEVEEIIQEYINNPERYQADVRAAQKKLARFSPQQFEKQIGAILTQKTGVLV